MKSNDFSRWCFAILTAALLTPTAGCGSSAKSKASGCTLGDNGDGTSTLTCNGRSIVIGNTQSAADAGPGTDGSVGADTGPGPGPGATCAASDGGVVLTCGTTSVDIPSGNNVPTATGAGPTTDVTSGANGCPAAVGNGTADDTNAIQCQIDYLSKTFRGGFLYFPSGSYRVTSTVHVKGAVTLVGAGQFISIITTANADLLALNFDTGCHYAGIRDMWILGEHDTSAPTQAVVHVDYPVPAIFRDSSIWGGKVALDIDGDDGVYEDLYIAGWGNNGGGGIDSKGANWYMRDKIDQGTTPTSFAFRQQARPDGAAVAENHFIQCDFSGSFANSVVISDGGTHSAITVFDGCVFSSPIVINSGRWTSFNNAEIGNPSLRLNDNSWLSITGSYGFSAMTVAGAGTNKVCVGDIRISC